jgi:hypothetical protein
MTPQIWVYASGGGWSIALMARLLAGLVLGAILMDSWRVAQEVGAGRELARLRLEANRAADEADRAAEHRRSDIEALAGPRAGELEVDW